MSELTDKIPFAIEMGRIIEVLAAQIYPTPFALLRENVQNSYDAILLRRQTGQNFQAIINIYIEQNRIQVIDNGIGMSREDLKNHFWRAGSSSKNTEQARAAGVVGTFGIGAMANFGIAEEIVVETESYQTKERTICSANRSTLSVTQDCISFSPVASTGSPGTTITAIIQPNKSIKVKDAEDYITQFVSYLPIDVNINGEKRSGQPMADSVPYLVQSWEIKKSRVDLGTGLKADVELSGAINGEIRVELQKIEYSSQNLQGKMILRQGIGTLKTFRSGFGLATTGVTSKYNFGGVADFLFLQPTAGREALTTNSMQLLQQIVSQIDEFVSIELANRPESNVNSYFVSWVAQHKRYDLCSHLRVRIEPGESMQLLDLRARVDDVPMLVYSGTDATTIDHASQDKPILVISRGHPRNECELGYLRKYCKIEEISNEPKVLRQKPESETNAAEKALSFRIASILSNDYFLDAHIKFGTISHGLPILVTNRKNPVEIFLDFAGSTARLILELYDKEYSAFNHMAKDFVRNMIFPRIADLVPSATRQGAEAFLKTINRAREIFEYDMQDLQSLTSIWQEYLNGKMNYQQAAERAEKIAVRSYQVLDYTAAAHVKDVVPDVIINEEATMQKDSAHFEALPPIQRLDVSTERKVLTIAENELALKGYRCFLALTDRIKEEKGDFFLQPHRTSVIWGGQKALFIFEHHSGNYGLYYDLQTQSLISNESGGGSFETCTIVMKNRIFIPIPSTIQGSFLPKPSEKKRFEVKCDILYIDRNFRDK
jgi:molecular chaperone HtpG